MAEIPSDAWWQQWARFRIASRKEARAAIAEHITLPTAESKQRFPSITGVCVWDFHEPSQLAPAFRAALASWLHEMDARRCYTPPALARAICETASLYSPPARFAELPRILEPSAGTGAFISALLQEGAAPAGIVAIEADPSAFAQLPSPDSLWRAHWGSFEHFASQLHGSQDLVVGNPPYEAAEAHVRLALSCARPDGGAVAFLLRQSFLASAQRNVGAEALFRAHRPHAIFTIVPRPIFYGGQSDSADYALIVWKHGASGPTTHDHLIWR